MIRITPHRALWIASTSMLGLAIAIVALAVDEPITAAPASDVSSNSADEVATSRQAPISRDALDRDASRPLRQPLMDEAAPAAAPMLAPPLPPLPPLVGTIVEPGKSVALLQIPGAPITFRRIGDFVADARIEAIDITGITVTRGGKKSFIRIDRLHAGPSPKEGGT